jgi:hypothetical protein
MDGGIGSELQAMGYPPAKAEVPVNFTWGTLALYEAPAGHAGHGPGLPAAASTPAAPAVQDPAVGASTPGAAPQGGVSSLGERLPI